MEIKAHKYPFWIILFFLSLPNLSFCFEIKGNIKLNSQWQNRLLVDSLPSVFDVYSVSKKYLMEDIPVDASGNYFVKGVFPDNNDHIIRLRIVKNGELPLTITTGGTNENYIFICVNNKSIVGIDANSGNFTGSYTVKNSVTSSLFREIRILRKDVYETTDVVTGTLPDNKKILKPGIDPGAILLEQIIANNRKLKKFIDTTNNILAALLGAAIYDYDMDLGNDIQYFDSICSRFKTSSANIC